MMKTHYKIIALAVLFGLLVGIAHAVLHYYLFYNMKFWDLLIFDVPAHELFMRSLIMVAFIIFGFILSRALARRTNAMNKLRANEEKFRVITKNSLDAIFIVDKKGNYVYVNHAVTEMLGYSSEELAKMNIVDISKKKDIKRSAVDFRKLLKMGSLFTELELVRKDGSVVPADLNAVVLPNGLIYGSCRDLTGRKKAENKIKKLKESLEQKVAKRTKELKEKVSELERFHDATVDREIRMKELRDENAELKKKLKERLL